MNHKWSDLSGFERLSSKERKEWNKMERYDIAIIGTGPAGISAAITATVRNKKVLLLGSRSLSSKVEKAHTIQNYPGLPNISGSDMQKAFLDHLQVLNIDITEEKINAVYAMGDYFAMQGITQQYEAKSVIVAAGMSVARPYPGENENLGRGVSYCATCDASLYRGRTAIMIAFSKEEEEEARFLAQLANKVIYLPMYEGEVDLSDNIEVIYDQKPERIERVAEQMKLVTVTDSFEADGIFILRDQLAPSQLVPGLRVKDNHVEADRNMQTNIKGLFACGDITGAPYQYIKAAGEGNVAALSAVSYLATVNL